MLSKEVVYIIKPWAYSQERFIQKDLPKNNPMIDLILFSTYNSIGDQRSHQDVIKGCMLQDRQQKSPG